MIAYATTFHQQRPIDVRGKKSDTRMSPYKNKKMWYDCLCDNFPPPETN